MRTGPGTGLTARAEGGALLHRRLHGVVFDIAFDVVRCRFWCIVVLSSKYLQCDVPLPHTHLPGDRAGKCL